MGQAKNRGSFEERKAKAIIKNQKEQDRLKQERESAKAERERNMTPEQRKNRQKMRAILATTFGIINQ